MTLVYRNPTVTDATVTYWDCLSSSIQLRCMWHTSLKKLIVIHGSTHLHPSSQTWHVDTTIYLSRSDALMATSTRIYKHCTLTDLLCAINTVEVAALNGISVSQCTGILAVGSRTAVGFHLQLVLPRALTRQRITINCLSTQLYVFSNHFLIINVTNTDLQNHSLLCLSLISLISKLPIRRRDSLQHSS